MRPTRPRSGEGRPGSGCDAGRRYLRRVPSPRAAPFAPADGSRNRAVGHDRALHRALHGHGRSPPRSCVRPPDHRHRPDRQRPEPLQRHPRAARAAVKDGFRAAGGIPIAFPTHPIFEDCRRPTAAIDRNLAYLGLVEILYGYPFDAVVLTTGCDKTTPSAIMAASTVDIPAIVLSGGPMLDGWREGELVGSGHRHLALAPQARGG